jgi:nucleoside-diphosphate-sugar epimerase
MTKKILVTGGAGMIGGYVVAELVRSGHEVVVMDQSRPDEPVAGVRYRLANHEDLGEVVALCPGMEAIVHLSAIPAPRTHPDSLVFRTNIMGAFNVHEAAVIAGVPLVVSASSQSAYGFAWQHRPFYPRYLPLDEAHPDLSQDAYGLSKMVGEQIAHAYHRRCDLRVCSIRPPLVVRPDLYQTQVRGHIAAPERWSETLYAYVDVRDLAAAFRLVVEAPAGVIQDEVFNVVADDALATEPLAELLPRVDPVLGSMAAGLVGRQSLISAARIRQVLGWQPAFSWRDVLDDV